MKTIIAPDPIVKGLHDGSITLIVVPMEKQPVLRPGFTLEVPGPCSIRAIPVCWDCAAHGIPNDSPYNVMWLTDEAISMPYGVGDVVGVQEAWVQIDYDMTDIYRADCDDEQRAIALRSSIAGDWQSCTDETIRTHLLIQSVEARLVGTITPDEAKRTGASPENAECNCPGGAYVNGFCGDWCHRYPQHPFESTWAWFYQVRKQ